MLQKVEIVEAGDTTFLVGEQVDRTEFNRQNNRVSAEGGNPSESLPVLQGITKAILQTSSFISAAAFQETRLLASFSFKTWTISGLKRGLPLVLNILATA